MQRILQGLELGSLLMISSLSVAVTGTSLSWYGSDVLDALLLVFSTLLALSDNYHYYLYILQP